MPFNSFAFLAAFAAFVGVYYALPHRTRWILLLVGSLLFYATFNVVYVALLVAVSVAAYVGGLLVAASADEARRRRTLAMAVVATLAPLLVFKYVDFLADLTQSLLDITRLAGALPTVPRATLPAVVGLSFYTFSSISYVIDVFGRRLEPERHFGHFVVYVSFFPKLLAGPVERARSFLPQLHREIVFDDGRVTLGLQLMLWGLFKKVVIADRLAGFVDSAYGQPAFAAPADLLLATYFFAFQLYCDFSGYSDIAIGAARVLGFDLAENFRRPYLSTSVSEFWSTRWHLSLTSWFRDYVYIPLGGNRVSRLRRHMNVMAVFVLSGLWHGASWTFVAWGALNGAYHILSATTQNSRTRLLHMLRAPAPLVQVFRALVTFHLILAGWVFFRADSVTDAIAIVSRVGGAAGRLPTLVAARLAIGDMWLAISLIAVLLIVETLDEKRPLVERLGVTPVYVRWAAYYALVFSLIVLGVWNLQQFVYAQF